MGQMKRMQGVLGPSPLDVYVAHWLHYGVHLPLGEEWPSEHYTDRVLAFRRLTRMHAPEGGWWSAGERMTFRPMCERFKRGELGVRGRMSQPPAWTKAPPWRPGACL